MDQELRNAIKVILEYVENWNKQDQDELVAEAAVILQEFLNENK